MKELIYLTLAIFLLSSCEKPETPEDELFRTDSISMGAGYVNDIYFSLENGVVKSSPRSDWDIAFSTNPVSSTILINEGYGAELYTYPNGDKESWDLVDTSGIDSWNKMYNSDTSWYNGAFDRNATGHPDYGWGIYNMTTHDVLGDSIFIVKTTEGKILKLFIEKRASSDNSFTFKYSDLVSETKNEVVACSPYSDRNFIYYSFATESIVDHEPINSSWDMVFTKYYDESIPYIVTGVLTNMDIEVAELRNMSTDLATMNDGVFSSSISEIGSDWKTFDMGSFTYLIEADLSYFVKTSSSTYKLVFKGTDGSASGKVVFDIEKVDPLLK